jgi:nitrate reductase (NAD(P)H)
MELSEILAHNTKSDCWIAINQTVYNVTDYLDHHPGGASIIVGCSGKDATKEFNQVGHSRNATKILAKYEVGQLAKPEEQPTFFQSIWTWFFPPKPNDTKALLLQRAQLTHDTIRLMFVVPRMDLKCGQHLIIYNGNMQRKYTPVQTTHNSFDLIVKVYDTGGMSAYLNKLRIGDRIQVSEPVGNKIYLGNGTFSNLNSQAKRMLMICAGTGITPMYPILRRISDNRENVYVDVLYVNKTSGDILLQDELEHLCLKSANITVQYAFTRIQEVLRLPLLQGRPTKEMIMRLGGCDLALICGPTGFNESVEAICKELGYPTQVF